MRDAAGDGQVKRCLWRISFLVAGILLLLASRADCQVEVGLKLDRTEFLLYEPIVVDVTLNNLYPQALDLVRMAKGEPWLDFLVTTVDEDIVSRTEKIWKPKNLALLQGQNQSISIDLMPYYLIREPGTYLVAAVVNSEGRTLSSGRKKINVVRGSTIWERKMILPALPETPKTVRPRLYSLIVLQQQEKQMLYARIVSEEEDRVYCTMPIGAKVNYGDPKVKIDPAGNLHVLHQSGSRIYNYTQITPNGKKLKPRFFSNLSSPPTMITIEKDEVQIVGGEEIFDEKDKEHDKSWSDIPTAPMVKPPTPKGESVLDQYR